MAPSHGTCGRSQATRAQAVGRARRHRPDMGPCYAGKDPEYYWYRDADNDGVVCE